MHAADKRQIPEPCAGTVRVETHRRGNTGFLADLAPCQRVIHHEERNGTGQVLAKGIGIGKQGAVLAAGDRAEQNAQNKKDRLKLTKPFVTRRNRVP